MCCERSNRRQQAATGWGSSRAPPPALPQPSAPALAIRPRPLAPAPQNWDISHAPKGFELKPQVRRHARGASPQRPVPAALRARPHATSSRRCCAHSQVLDMACAAARARAGAG